MPKGIETKEGTLARTPIGNLWQGEQWRRSTASTKLVIAIVLSGGSQHTTYEGER